jgi:dihydroorotate dehydrogenase
MRLMLISMLWLSVCAAGTAPAPLNETLVSGFLYGPALLSFALRTLYSLKSWIDLPLIAAGGIHSLADAQAFLTAGAAAVQIDTLIFIEPKSAYDIALALRSPLPSTT